MSKEDRLHIFTNSYCNSGCLFCSDVRWTNKTPLDILNKNAEEDLRSMKDKMSRVLFTAAEPTLNEKLVYFIGLAKKYGYKEIGLITNGRKLKDRKYCESLFKAGLNGINVSLHGSRKEINDRLTRVPGSFEETFIGLCNLSFLKEKYSFNFYVNFLANKLNYFDLQPFLRMIIGFKGINGIVLNTVLPKGQAEKCFEEIIPSYRAVGRKIVKTLNDLERESHENTPTIRILGLPPCLLPGQNKRIISHESAITRGHPAKDKRRLIKARWEGKIKGVLCKKCKFSRSCSGVWESYIKKRGWDEFKPVQ
jgi:MoaA/NifB/PqqE/SkfB family radical SAM enzyme